MSETPAPIAATLWAAKLAAPTVEIQEGGR